MILTISEIQISKYITCKERPVFESSQWGMQAGIWLPVYRSCGMLVGMVHQDSYLGDGLVELVQRVKGLRRLNGKLDL